MQRYRDGGAESGEPHTFAVAERVYSALREKDAMPQSVVVSGESGAGKTETNKHLMAYLRWRSGTASSGRPGDAALGERMSRVISLSNVVLEALGNAKTTNNNNSSRFGKYLEIIFDSNGVVSGANFKTFLLEKSRVARQAPKERNYHVFYQLCAGAAPDTRSNLGLRDASKHAYTSTHTQVHGADDGALFRDLGGALRDGQMKDANLYGALSAVLHLGDVTFEGDEDGCTTTKEGRAALEAACARIGIDVDELHSRLTERYISVGRDDVCIPLDPQGAGQVRDALSKAIYQRVFAFHVAALNDLLQPGAWDAMAPHTPSRWTQMSENSEPSTPRRRKGSVAAQRTARQGSVAVSREASVQSAAGGADADAGGGSVGLLDVFGFESLHSNGFEQLCINYANEKLHSIFLRHVFQDMPDEQLASVLGDDTTGINNAPCLALLEAPPNGIFHLLDHQCKAPQASENSFCMAVNMKHRNHIFFKEPKISKTCPLDQSSGFIVRHFAGDVLYAAGHFLELNNDSMYNSHWLKTVSEPFVKHLFTAPELQPVSQSSRGGASFSSVGQKFAADLEALMRTLRSTETHFIRCMKPNLQMAPRSFDSEYVRSRVRAAGSLAALKFMKRLQGGGKLSYKTLRRLQAKPHVEKLPAALRTEKDEQKFASGLLKALGVPVQHFRATDDGVTLSTGLVPYLVVMEEQGEATDADAAKKIAEVVAQIEAQAKADEKASKAPGHTGRQDAARARSERKASVAATQAFAKTLVVQKNVSTTDGLLEWCKAQTFGYAGVAITNFSASWNDGLAMVALLHKHAPNAVPSPETLKADTPDARKKNFELAFGAAEKVLGVSRLLDVEDMLDTYPKPDSKSVTLYISQIANAINGNAPKPGGADGPALVDPVDRLRPQEGPRSPGRGCGGRGRAHHSV